LPEQASTVASGGDPTALSVGRVYASNE